MRNLCECGCGQEVKPGNRFINGHQNRYENHPLYGNHHSEETKQKMSAGNKGKHHSEETKKKISEAKIGLNTGENNSAWKGGVSFQPYCIKFNDKLKEDIRNKYYRKCQLCGKNEQDNIMKNGKFRKLDIHHIDMDKEQGCNGKEWKLIPLCMSCHRKLHKKPYGELKNEKSSSLL